MPKLRAEDRKSQPGKKRKEVWLVDILGSWCTEGEGGVWREWRSPECEPANRVRDSEL